MYPVERFLKKLKDYVLNKARPEGSIAEGYLIEETSSFCSMYMDDIDTRFNCKERNYDGAPFEDVHESSSIFNYPGRFLTGKVETRILSEEEVNLAHIYILKQIEQMDQFFDIYKESFQITNALGGDFLKWFRLYVQELKVAKDPRCTEDIEVLSQTPSRFAYSHSGYIVNGFRFRTNTVDDTKLTQLSGVIVVAELDSGCDGYYGRLIDVIEMCFAHQKRIVLFQCEWWDVYTKDRGFKIDKYGIVSLNTRFKLNTNEPFSLASQVEQVFYVNDNKAPGWIIPVRAQPRNYYNVNNEPIEGEGDDIGEAYQETLIDVHVGGDIFDVDIVEGISVRVGEYIDA
jgi:hypothetical protein